jgi:hypothetical protein
MRASIIYILAALAAGMYISPAAAAGKKQVDLRGDGYKCVRVSVNFIECTKDGAPTYWCTDAGVCEQAPSRVGNGGNARAPTSGVLDTRPRPSQRRFERQMVPPAPVGR